MYLKKIIIPLSLLLVSITPSSVLAQEKILSDKVEVTKDFTPTIAAATKREILPTVEEHIEIKTPVLSYSIGYKPEKYPFSITPLSAPSYKLDTDSLLYKGYVDFAVGIPFSTKANASYATTEMRNMIFAADVSHYGFWGKIDDATGVGQSATTSENALDLYFDYQKNNLRTKIFLTQQFDIFNRYGFDSAHYTSSTTSDESIKQHFLKTSLGAELGSNLAADNKTNANVYMQFDLVNDKYSYNESTYQAGVYLDRQVESLGGLLKIRAEYTSVVPTDKFYIYPLVGEEEVVAPTPDDYTDGSYLVNQTSPTGILSVSPGIAIKRGGFNIDFDLDMNFDFNGNKNNYEQGVSTILPKLMISYASEGGGFIPYLKIDGDYEINNYFTLTEKNPYIIEGLTAPNTTIRQYYFGFKGTISNCFSYNLHAGVRQSRDLVMFINTEGGNVFAPMAGDFDNTEVVCELAYNHDNIFNASLAINYIDYSTDNIDEAAIGYSPLTATLNLRYQATTALKLNLMACMLSERMFGTLVNDEVVVSTSPSVLDLALGAEYSLSNRLTATLTASNLLGEELYQYNNYKGLGTSVMLGLTYRF